MNSKVLFILICSFTILTSCSSREKVRSLASEKFIIIDQSTSSNDFFNLVKKLPKRNKFTFSANKFVVSTTGSKKPKHDTLLGRDKLVSAGYVSFNILDNKIINIELDNYSGRLCPSYKSLSYVASFLSDFVQSQEKITLFNNPNLEKCN